MAIGSSPNIKFRGPWLYIPDRVTSRGAARFPGVTIKMWQRGQAWNLKTHMLLLGKDFWVMWLPVFWCYCKKLQLIIHKILYILSITWNCLEGEDIKSLIDVNSLTAKVSGSLSGPCEKCKNRQADCERSLSSILLHNFWPTYQRPFPSGWKHFVGEKHVYSDNFP